MNYGTMISKARKDKGITQAELGKRLGVSRQTIIYWEHEDAKPSDEVKMPLCKELGIDPEPFLLAIVSSGT